MDSLPEELITRILDFCDVYSLLQMRQVNLRLNFCANDHLWRRRSLSLGNEYVQMNPKIMNRLNEDTTIRIEKIIEFLGNFMPKLKQLSISGIPCKISLTNICQLSNSVPNIENLEISCENGYPLVEADAFRGLVMFKELRRLTATDWQPKIVVRRGGVHRQEGLPPIGQLEELIMSSGKDNVMKILAQMKAEGVLLPKLKEITLSDTLSSSQMPSTLTWFVGKHKSLKRITLHKVLFATINELEAFLGSVITHPRLYDLLLIDCNVVEFLHPQDWNRFIGACKIRKLNIQGQVSSLRFLPLV